MRVGVFMTEGLEGVPGEGSGRSEWAQYTVRRGRQCILLAT
jgi:hypothetical protein